MKTEITRSIAEAAKTGLKYHVVSENEQANFNEQHFCMTPLLHIAEQNSRMPEAIRNVLN